MARTTRAHRLASSYPTSPNNTEKQTSPVEWKWCAVASEKMPLKSRVKVVIENLGTQSFMWAPASFAHLIFRDLDGHVTARVC
jgi:hypothetical protein